MGGKCKAEQTKRRGKRERVGRKTKRTEKRKEIEGKKIKGEVYNKES